MSHEAIKLYYWWDQMAMQGMKEHHQDKSW